MPREEFDFGNRPAGIDPTPRNSDHGTVVDEVGVFQNGGSKDYWKVIQRIESSGRPEIRLGYYENQGSGWDWRLRPVMLPPQRLNRLWGRAISQGILVR